MGWSGDEDRALLRAHALHCHKKGGKWGLIAAMLPGRSVAAVEQHYAVLGKRATAPGAASPAVGSATAPVHHAAAAAAAAVVDMAAPVPVHRGGGAAAAPAAGAADTDLAENAAGAGGSGGGHTDLVEDAAAAGGSRGGDRGGEDDGDEQAGGGGNESDDEDEPVSGGGGGGNVENTTTPSSVEVEAAGILFSGARAAEATVGLDCPTPPLSLHCSCTNQVHTHMVM